MLLNSRTAWSGVSPTLMSVTYSLWTVTPCSATTVAQKLSFRSSWTYSFLVTTRTHPMICNSCRMPPHTKSSCYWGHWKSQQKLASCQISWSRSRSLSKEKSARRTLTNNSSGAWGPAVTWSHGLSLNNSKMINSHSLMVSESSGLQLIQLPKAAAMALKLCSSSTSITRESWSMLTVQI